MMDGRDSSRRAGALSYGDCASVDDLWKRVRLLAKPLGELRPRMAAWWRRGVDIVYPPRCAFCDADLVAYDGGPMLCARCRGVMVPEVWTGCPRCAAPARVAQSPAPRCRYCRSDDFHFDAAAALGIYCEELAQAVLMMKHESGVGLAKAMGGVLASVRSEELAAFRVDFVLSVPMFWLTRLARKTNSPDLLAAVVAHSLGVEAIFGLLKRCRKTLPQKSLRHSERFRNVAGSFKFRKGYDIDGARVLVVDDVMTTGATCDAAAAVLKRAGAAYVAVAVLARGIGGDNL
jgi:predicted amidophosphoribosyltransferase